MSKFLEPEELRQLTGCTIAVKQSRWVTKKRIPHHLDNKRNIVSCIHARGWLEKRPLYSSSRNWESVS